MFGFSIFIFDSVIINLKRSSDKIETCIFCCFHLFFEKMKNWFSCNDTDVRFKIIKYQHLELILRETKLNYAKLILNVTTAETKIEIECNKKTKKNKNVIKTRKTLLTTMYSAPVLLFEITHSGLSALRVIASKWNT